MTAKRGRRRGTKRLDLSTLREALKDTRVWSSLAVVIQPDGEAGASHWDLVTDDAGNVTDVVVEVVLVPDNVEVTARLNTLGVLQVPEVGDEVLVVFPAGQIDWMPTIMGRLSTGMIPNPTGQGPSPTTILICPPPGGRVLVYDGDTGEAESLVTLAEHQALCDHVDGHKHAGVFGGSGSAPALTSPPTNSNTGTPLDGCPEAEGTQVLLAK